MRPQGVLWLSRLSQAEFHARPLGTMRACGAGASHHLGRGLSVRDSLHLAMMNGCSSAWKAWERSQRSWAEALRRGGEGGAAPGGPLVRLSRPLSSALEREQEGLEHGVGAFLNTLSGTFGRMGGNAGWATTDGHPRVP